jgi:hypothetical protein
MAKFQARCPNQVLCIKPARVSIVEGIPYPVPGEHIRFENGEFETTDKDKIAYLKKHRLFGTSIVEVTKVGEQEPPVDPPKE